MGVHYRCEGIGANSVLKFEKGAMCWGFLKHWDFRERIDTMFSEEVSKGETLGMASSILDMTGLLPMSAGFMITNIVILKPWGTDFASKDADTVALRRRACRAMVQYFSRLFEPAPAYSDRASRGVVIAEDEIRVGTAVHAGVMYNRLRFLKRFATISADLAQAILDNPEMSLILSSCYGCGDYIESGDDVVIKPEQLDCDEDLTRSLMSPDLFWNMDIEVFTDESKWYRSTMTCRGLDFTAIMHDYDGETKSNLYECEEHYDEDYDEYYEGDPVYQLANLPEHYDAAVEYLLEVKECNND